MSQDSKPRVSGAEKAVLSGVTPRAVILGVVAAAAMAAINPYTAYIADLWIPGNGALLHGPLQLLVILVAVNTALGRWAPRFAFSRQELIVTYGMLMISVVNVYGLYTNFVTFLSYPIYQATPENAWAQLILPHVPQWLSLGDPYAVWWFWEGIPEGEAIPWGAWFTPLLSVCGVYVALMASVFCLGALVSRDWVERQRLAFPMAEVPLAVARGDRPSLGSSILASPIFWLGFAVPAAQKILQYMHNIYPAVPSVPWAFDLGVYFKGRGLPWNALGDLNFNIYWIPIGIACLIPGEVSLSLWLFFVLYRVQMLVWGSLGFGTGEAAVTGFDPRTFIGFQEAGGYLALSAVVLYQSRRALAVAWRGLGGRGNQEDEDPYGVLRLRGALAGFLAANVFLLWWLARSGMAGWYAGVTLVFLYAYCLTSSRLVAAGGVVFNAPYLQARHVLSETIGTRVLGPGSLTTGAYMDVLFLSGMYQGNMPIGHMFTSFKLLNASKTSGKGFPWVTLLGVVAALVVGLPVLINLAYTEGANTMSQWFFGGTQQHMFGQLDAGLRNPSPPSNLAQAGLLVGAAVTLALSYMHTHYLWWSLSPIGFVIASGVIANRIVWSSALIGWLTSTILRRAGGLRLYRAAVPAFFGLILAEVVVSLLLALISAVFGLEASPWG